jgi:hypothetical protein
VSSAGTAPGNSNAAARTGDNHGDVPVGFIFMISL